MKKASLARPTTETRPFIIQRTGNRKIYRLYVYDGKFITPKTKRVKYRYTTLVESYVRKDCVIVAQEWLKGNVTEWWTLV
jgi:predicted methyltransferase MtxX (methanogen marker protein 4)